MMQLCSTTPRTPGSERVTEFGSDGACTMIENALTWSVVSFVNVPNDLTDALSSFRQKHTQDAQSISSLLCGQQERHWVYIIDSYL
jgi:hypothetical protein